ncbi:MAG: class I SAM-dependent methyltransferase [Polyangiales bacterium]
MGFYSDYIVPRCIDFALSRPPILELRERVTHGLKGNVLEIGFGSGLNLAYYPAEVTQVLALDPARFAQKLAKNRIADCSIPVRWVDLPPSGRLPLPDACVDAVLSTFTMCTIPELDSALQELHRVLKPCGKLHFVEHGRSPEPQIARWQDRLTPLQRRVAGGCHLNRPIADSLRDSGFCLDALQTFYLRGPKFATHIYEGVACACRKQATDGHDVQSAETAAIDGTNSCA